MRRAILLAAALLAASDAAAACLLFNFRVATAPSSGVEYTLTWQPHGDSCATSWEVQESADFFRSVLSTRTVSGTPASSYTHTNGNAVPAYYSYRVRELTASGPGPWSAARAVQIPGTMRPRRANPDLNGDGRADLFFYSDAYPNVDPFVKFMNGLTPLGGYRCCPGAALAWPPPVWLNTGDMDDDGDTDLYHYSTNVGQPAVPVLINGPNFEVQVTAEQKGQGPVEPYGAQGTLGVYNFNGTNASELWRGTGGAIEIWDRDVYGRILARTRIWTEPDPKWRIVAVNDFNGDGRDDLLFRHADSGSCFMLLPRATPVRKYGIYHREPDLDWRIVATGDTNGDGRADIVWRNSATGRVYIQFMDGLTRIGYGIITTEPDPNWKVVGLMDLNGDGKTDLVWRNAADGRIFAQLLDGARITAGAVIHREPDPVWRLVAPGVTTQPDVP